MKRILTILALAPLVAACSHAALADQSHKEQLACAEIGMDPGSAAFNQCVADLHWNIWYQTQGPASR